jgi:hypothetical protein
MSQNPQNLRIEQYRQILQNFGTKRAVHQKSIPTRPKNPVNYDLKRSDPITKMTCKSQECCVRRTVNRLHIALPPKFFIQILSRLKKPFFGPTSVVYFPISTWPQRMVAAKNGARSLAACPQVCCNNCCKFVIVT